MSDSLPESPESHRAWLTRMFERYERPLVAYARSLLRGDLECARDAVQDTFLRLCREPWPAIESKAEAWLFCVCRHRCLDLLKRWEHRMQSTLQPNQLADQSDHRTVDPAAQTEQGDVLAQLRCMIQKLSARQQEILSLRLQQQMSYQQIADVTGLTVANVGYHLHEAIMTLRKQM